MESTANLSLVLLAAMISPAAVLLPPPYDETKLLSSAGGPLEAVLSTASYRQCSLVLFLDGRTSATDVFGLIHQLQVPSGVGVFEVATDGQDANMTQDHLSRLVIQARRLRQLSWCVRVVVVSDDPAFLAAFAQWSLKGRLLVWSTRLLALTRLPLQQLHHLQRTFSMTNSILLILDNIGHNRYNLYLHLPYKPLGSPALLVASWTLHRGLALATSHPLFPEKFLKFLEWPQLVMVSEESPMNRMVNQDDAAAPPGKQLSFTGSMASLVDYLAKSLNFS